MQILCFNFYANFLLPHVLRQSKEFARIFALSVALSIFSLTSHAATKYSDYKVVLVIADESDITKLIVSTAQKKLNASVVLIDGKSSLKRERNNIYLAIGPNALRSLVDTNADGIVVSAFTSSQAYHAIIEGASEVKKNQSTVTAIYADPAPADQIKLVAAIYKHPVGIGAILSEKTNYLKSTLQQIARRNGFSLSVVELIDNDINRALNQLSSVRVLLATPDSNVYNSTNIRNILLTTYRHNQSVIGFSNSLVKAGALAAVYSDVDDIVIQLDELLREIKDSGQIPDPQYPKYFNVLVNDGVARSLDLIIDDSVLKLSRRPR
jgi:ABC-type uncharacterized transport system substrate-binding protein